MLLQMNRYALVGTIIVSSVTIAGFDFWTSAELMGSILKAFLQKPVDNAELLAVIRQALGEAALPAGVVGNGEFPLFRG
jgi:hypothetical protein